ncbi:MAG TPA: hypothetical protein VHD60_00860 [Candidatus Saccharimonadales bacterium]|nr:hypothetical protein [Candidatus Saccharimonadales bacterium]
MSEEANEELKYTEFTVDGKTQAVEFVETTPVIPGVSCDVYRFVNDETKDLAIVTVQPAHTTPRQRVMAGMRTVEGYVSGQGILSVQPVGDGHARQYVYGGSGDLHTQTSVEIDHGEVMQWMAAEGDTPLVFYELCEPPYEEGRFENLPD